MAPILPPYCWLLPAEPFCKKEGAGRGLKIICSLYIWLVLIVFYPGEENAKDK